MILSAFISIVSAVNFVVDTPAQNQLWPQGSMMDIRWHMDNVSLPYEDLRVNLDLFRFQGGASTLYRSIASGVVNNGHYEWSIFNDIPTTMDTFKIVVSSFGHNTGYSGKFVTVLISPSDATITITSPQKNDVYYANNDLNIQWEKGYPLPDLIYGINAEIRTMEGAGIVSVARNVTSSTDKGSVSWHVNDNLPLQKGQMIFAGQLLLWGYDARSQRVVHGSVEPVYVDYTDRVALTISYLLPNPSAVWTMGTKVPIVIRIQTQDQPDANVPLARDVSIELALYNNDNERISWILPPGSNIKKQDWNQGAYTIEYDVPTDISLTKPSAAQQGQFAIMANRKFYLHYDAKYSMQEPEKQQTINGNSGQFEILGPQRKPSAAINILADFPFFVLSALLILMW